MCTASRIMIERCHHHSRIPNQKVISQVCPQGAATVSNKTVEGVVETAVVVAAICAVAVAQRSFEGVVDKTNLRAQSAAVAEGTSRRSRSWRTAEDSLLVDATCRDQ